MKGVPKGPSGDRGVRNFQDHVPTRFVDVVAEDQLRALGRARELAF